MKVIMNEKQLTDLIQKYQKEEMNFDGEVELMAEEYHDLKEDYTIVKAVATGKLQLLGKTLDLIQEIKETEIENIIKFYLENAGYKTGYIRFTSAIRYEEKYKHYDDYHGSTVFDNVEIEIKQNVKTKGGI